MEINKTGAIMYLLDRAYVSEFQVIDGVRRHPDFVGFAEWLYQRGIITREEMLKELAESKIA